MRLLSMMMMALALALVGGCASVKPTGQVAVGDRPIAHALAGKGTPTIVLEAGLGNGMDSWAEIYTQASAISTTVAYDRPGYGRSLTNGERLRSAAMDAIPGSELLGALELATRTARPTTGAVAAARLEEVLRRVGARPPYILVGHSLGGQYVQIYAARHPEKVAGIVLVDSRPKGFTAACLRRGLSPCEVPGWMRAVVPGNQKDEIDGLAETDSQTPTPQALGDIPVIRLVATEWAMGLNAAFHGLWVEMQQAEQRAQRRGRLELVADSGHDIMDDRPEVVLAAIRELVERYRAGGAGEPPGAGPIR